MYMDLHAMHRATKLAIRGIGYTKSNPLVGCVLKKNKKIIGEGWHEQFGTSHAEINALQNAEKKGHSAKNSEVFLTLEPCFHTGKTPPCVDVLIKKQVKSVHVLFSDPNPETQGNSLQKLQEHGIEVFENYDHLNRQYEYIYEDFFHWITQKKPFMTLKMALDTGGYISDGSNEKLCITGKEAKKYTHFLRQKHEAVLVGVQTICTDNPHLGVRHGDFYQGYRDPLRIIFDPHCRSPQDATVFRDENFLIIVAPESEQKAQRIFGKRIHTLPLLENNMFDLPQFQKDMWGLKIPSILVEGGKKTNREFLKQKCVNKGVLYVSPKTLVKEGLKGIDFRDTPEFEQQRTEKLSEDTLFEGRFIF